MGFRFQRRVTLFPGVRLNFSPRGISATIGPRGASVNFGSRGSALNLGIPGTGLSFRHTLGSPSRPGRANPPQAIPEAAPPPLPLQPALPETAIESAPVEQVTSDGLKALKDLILQVRDERERLRTSIMEASREHSEAKARLARAQHWFFGLFLKKQVPERTADVEDWAETVRGLEGQLDGAVVATEFDVDEATHQEFMKLTDGFRGAARCERIWDITTTRANDPRATRSLATSSIRRVPVKFGLIEEDEVLRTEGKALRLQNANGSDLNIYPGFLLMRDGVRVGLLDLRELIVEFTKTKFIETDSVPKDSVVVGQTWAKTNKDGSPDRRFRGNYQIPIAQYGEVSLSSSTGINESYQFSNADKAEAFAKALRSYQSVLKALGERPPEETASVLPYSALPASPGSSEAAPGVLKAVDFLAVRTAASFDEAKDALAAFFELLKGDVEAMNGSARKATELEAFVASLPTVPETLQAYCGRSPAAEALREVATRETKKMLIAVLDQLEAMIEPHKESDELAGLRGAVADARPRLSA